MGLYGNKSECARLFGVSRETVRQLVRGIEKEIDSGRYSRYALVGTSVNKAVLLDYIKYKNALDNRATRKYVPAFDEIAAARAIGEETGI